MLQVQPEPSEPFGSSTKEEGGAMRWIDSYEKALVFWLGMVGIAFASIVIGMKLGNLITAFV